MNEKIFDNLYFKDDKGKIRNWNIKVVNCGDYSNIIILHGYIRQIEVIITVNKGKNLGKKKRKNENMGCVINAPKAKAQVCRYLKSCSHGIFICGSTGSLVIYSSSSLLKLG